MKSYQDWLRDNKHLPSFMKDFHDQKDLFKTIDGFFAPSETYDKHYYVPWVQAQIYTVDRFLWFMAIHGYSLQRNRSDVDFKDIVKTLDENRSKRLGEFKEVLSSVIQK